MGAEQSTEGAPAEEPAGEEGKRIAPSGALADTPQVSVRPLTDGSAITGGGGGGDGIVAGATPGLPLVSAIEEMGCEDVLKTFGIVTGAGNVKDSGVATACCKRLRVLCRETVGRQQCEQLDAARIMIGTIDALSPLDATLALQSLAALVNICAERDVDSLRDSAVNAGALRVAVRAIDEHHKENMQVAEMACLLVRNLCCGKDDNVLERRKQAAEAGVIESTVAAMGKYEDSPIAPNIIVALRLVVDRLPDQRTRATKCGAKADWVKPVTKEGGDSFLSFRGGFGTNRRAAKTPPKVMQTSTLGGIQEEA